MSVTAGAPDSTFSALRGDKSQWQLSLDQLESRLVLDLDAMTQSYFSFEHEYVALTAHCSAVG